MVEWHLWEVKNDAISELLRRTSILKDMHAPISYNILNWSKKF
uniref:Uncharacterized protein n=1 Tax=Rhizophora mucronata TaxID=61149 RepID=A0A2P2PRJ1_RHIMU